MYFSRSLYANTSSSGEMERQWRDMWARRTLANNMEQAMFEQSRAAGMQVNAAAIIPRDVYQELDSVTTRIFREDDGDTILNDLMPMSRAVSIGKIEYKFRRASDSGNAVTSLSGQGVIGLDKAQYSYDGTVIPVHQDGYGREWRELEGQRSEMFDGLIDDQENSVRAVRRKMVDWILDGDDAISGPSGQTWGGIRNDSRVAKVDLGAGGLNIDFTSSSVSGEDIRKAFIQLVDALRITNKVAGQVTFYVSRTIMSNFQRYYTATDRGTILAELLTLNGIAAIKESSKLTGNQVMGVVLSSQYIMPLVGMSVATVPVQRQNPFDQYNFLVWSAMGLMVKTDYANRTGVLYASA